jgi:dGTPase
MTMYTDNDWARREGIVDPQPEDYRSPARRDAARVLHSPAFRRQQGKTQLFPGIESDFFRNRLTHSLEVGQIAKSIAIRLNATERFLKPQENKIDTDLVEVAGWCHDLGHPPFGHTGESALDRAMRETDGGFEGNAQTLRILSRLEKRSKGVATASGISDDGKDMRWGLNLTARTLAACLKYDSKIPAQSKDRANGGVAKGYYDDDADTVRWVKKQVAGDDTLTPFKTIECKIMDLADDIAYSTYDLEDAFKADFLDPLEIVAATDAIAEEVAQNVAKALGESFNSSDVRKVMRDTFGRLAATEGVTDPFDYAVIAQRTSSKLASDGYLRARFSSALVGEFIRAVKFEPNEKIPALSTVTLDPTVRAKVEVLKNLSYVTLISRPRLKVAEYRGLHLVGDMFNTLNADKEGKLLPYDFGTVFNRTKPVSKRSRVVCDFIAGMTDRYAVEYFGRLSSESPQTIFKPI